MDLKRIIIIVLVHVRHGESVSLWMSDNKHDHHDKWQDAWKKEQSYPSHFPDLLTLNYTRLIKTMKNFM